MELDEASCGYDGLAWPRLALPRPQKLGSHFSSHPSPMWWTPLGARGRISQIASTSEGQVGTISPLIQLGVKSIEDCSGHRQFTYLLPGRLQSHAHAKFITDRPTDLPDLPLVPYIVVRWREDGLSPADQETLASMTEISNRYWQVSVRAPITEHCALT